MAEYQLTAGDSIIRTEDGACIPPDPANRDYAEYLQWVEDGGVPDPWVEPPPPEPMPTTEQQILFDHENRVLALEGKPPITAEDFIAKATRTPAPTSKPKARSR